MRTKCSRVENIKKKKHKCIFYGTVTSILASVYGGLWNYQILLLVHEQENVQTPLARKVTFFLIFQRKQSRVLIRSPRYGVSDKYS